MKRVLAVAVTSALCAFICMAVIAACVWCFKWVVHVLGLDVLAFGVTIIGVALFGQLMMD